jgi:hypothetical protein
MTNEFISFCFLYIILFYKMNHLKLKNNKMTINNEIKTIIFLYKIRIKIKECNNFS